jgi:hypothetical protein
MKSSDLIRWSGLAAVIAAALFIVIQLITLTILLFGQEPLVLLVRAVILPLGGALLVLGMVGLYARQAEATHVLGLVGFLLALIGTVLALSGNAWANLGAYLGWALFGVASWEARVYPPTAAILLIVGAATSAPFSTLVVGAPSVFVYMSIGAHILFNVAIAWLGFALFSGRSVPAEQTRNEE